MTHDEFIEEYKKVAIRVMQLSEKARREGLLAVEDVIDGEKGNQRDILEYGLRFMVDGTDQEYINDILSNIVQQEEDKYTQQLMNIKKEAVLSIHCGENKRKTAAKINSFTDLSLKDDPIFQKLEDEDGRLSKDEIDALIGGRD